MIGRNERASLLNVRPRIHISRRGNAEDASDFYCAGHARGEPGQLQSPRDRLDL